MAKRREDMAFTIRAFQISVNQLGNPIDFFLKEHNAIQHFKKEVCFARYIGMDGSEQEYFEQIQKIENYLQIQKPDINYLRLNHLEKSLDMEKIDYYIGIYTEWERYTELEKIYSLSFPFIFQNSQMELTQKVAFGEVVNLYKKITLNSTLSMKKNFAVKLLGWIELYLPKLYNREFDLMNFPKLMWIGDIKQQEFLFLYFLALIGCDVLYLNSNEDIEKITPQLKDKAYLYNGKYKRKCKQSIPDFQPKSLIQAAKNTNAHSLSYIEEKQMEKREEKKELDYEELAKLSISVVMITVYDKNKQLKWSGSGVVINKGGYILTNFHVVEGGVYYGIKFENEEEEYLTNRLIKYHSINDLALIRIEGRVVKPLEIYRGNDLVRGHKVVAIGSPLGLFNTVSDGIISGFREIHQTSIIQFTAPISGGSSGGALIDLSGKLIGIIVGHFDGGQNLNLAIDYKMIMDFAGNFL